MVSQSTILLSTSVTSTNLNSVDEDESNPTGQTVNDLISSNYSGGATLVGVVITTNSATTAQGKWQWQAAGFSDPSVWNDIDASGTLSDDNALFLTSTTKLRFLPGSDFNGNPGILSTRLVDGGALSNGSTVDADPNGNGTIYSASTFALGSTINAIYDAPT